LETSATVDLESPSRPKVKSVTYIGVGKEEWGKPEFDAGLPSEDGQGPILWLTA